MRPDALPKMTPSLLVVFLVVATSLPFSARSKVPPCRMVIFSKTRDHLDKEFLDHVDQYFKQHATMNTISGFLQDGVVYLGIRFYVNPQKNCIKFQPDYLTLDMHFDPDDGNRTFVKQLEGLTPEEFLKILKEELMTSFGKKTATKHDFSGLLADNVILNYYMSETLMTPPLFHYVLTEVSAQGPVVLLMDVGSNDIQCRVPRNKIPPATFKRGPVIPRVAGTYRIYKYFTGPHS